MGLGGRGTGRICGFPCIIKIVDAAVDHIGLTKMLTVLSTNVYLLLFQFCAILYILYIFFMIPINWVWYKLGRRDVFLSPVGKLITSIYEKQQGTLCI